MEYRPIAKIDAAEGDVRAYLECAEWCGLADEQREALELSVSPEWSPASIAQASEDLGNFRALCEEQLDVGPLRNIGHDFWLTRNHHGTGFWDRGLGQLGDDLTKIAHTFGESNVDFDDESETLSLT